MNPEDPTSLLDAVCSATTDAVFVKDLAGRYLYVNPACTALFGRPAAEIIGTDDDRWFGPEAGAELRAYDRAVLATGVAQTVDEEHALASGLHIFSTTKAPYRAATGELLGIIGIARDVTAVRAESRQIRSERDLLAGLANVFPGALVSFRRRLDGRGEIVYIGPRIVDIIGATPAELEGDLSPWLEAIHPHDRERVQAERTHAIATMTTFQCAYRVRHPTRGERWVDLRLAPMRDDDGSMLWHGAIIDITDQKRTALLNEAVIESVPDYIMFADRDLRIRFVNQVWPGFTRDDVIGTPVAQWIAPEDQAQTLARYARVLATGSLEVVEMRIAAPDGGYRWVNTRAAPVFADGEIVGLTLAAIDITARKQAEDELRASRAMLRSVLETMPDLLISVDRDLRISYINRSTRPLEELVGTSAIAHLEPESAARAAATIQRVFETGELAEYDVELRPELGGSWMHTRVGPVVEDGRVVRTTLLATDLSARRRAERALRESEDRYRKLVDVLPDAVLVHVDGAITYVNQRMLALVGATHAAQLLGTAPVELLHPDDRADANARLHELLTSNQTTEPMVRRLRALDGTIRPVSVTAAPIVEAGRRGMLVVLHDLSAQERADLLLRSVHESVPDAILTIDTRGLVQSCNPAVARLFGYAPAEVVGHNVAMLMPSPHHEHHDEYLATYQRTGIATVVGIGREIVAKRKDGATFPADLMVTSFELNGKTHFTGVMRDLSERKRLEEQFRQAHKMEAFGQLAGGVAHDFNNLLTVIMGAAELVSEAIALDDPAHADLRVALGDMQHASHRAADLTRQLLAFSRKTVLEPRVLDINDTVHDTEKILRRLIGEDIVLVTRLASSLRPVFVDPGQLGQVIMNLCLNARDAMPTGGRIELHTDNVDLPDGPFVRLSVRDTGTGMSEEVRAQVFQPFFTTKEVGRGTGLGLAVVHGVVTQSGGRVAVTSTVGEGSTFEIVLPVATRNASRPDLAVPAAAARASETVLVVEDDEQVRRLAVRALGSRGYKVLVAPDGVSALQVLEEHGGKVDLAVVDVVMPRMNGRQLATAIEQRFPQIPVLFVSGYTDDMIESRGVDSGRVNLLNKPYSIDSLARAVARVIEQRRQGSR